MATASNSRRHRRSHRALPRFVEAAGHVLRALKIDEGKVVAELNAMGGLVVAPTNDRRVLGTGEWRRLIPTSWRILPEAARTAWTYLHLTLPPRRSARLVDSSPDELAE